MKTRGFTSLWTPLWPRFWEQLRPICIGVLVSFLCLLPYFFWHLFPEWVDFGARNWQILSLGLVFSAVIVLIYKLQGYTTGLTDLLLVIHTTPLLHPVFSWLKKGLQSLFLCIFTGVVGPEAAAIEVAYGAASGSRNISARWFDHLRRTDASMCLAAGVSAAFGAPLAGVMVPIELRFGGNTYACLMSAIVAYFCTPFLARIMGMYDWNYFLYSSESVLPHLGEIGFWKTFIAVVLACGVAGTLLSPVIGHLRDQVIRLVKGKMAWFFVVGTISVAVMVHLGARLYATPAVLASQLSQMVALSASPYDLGVYLLGAAILVVLLQAFFGFMGVFSYSIVLGFLLTKWITVSFFGPQDWMLPVGAAALWGSLLGLPLSGALVAQSLSGNLFDFFPLLVAGFAAHGLRKFFGVPSLVECDASLRGLVLEGGRSRDILQAITVGEAMVTDHEYALENENLSQLLVRFKRSAYPFLPIVNSKGYYMGILTADLVETSLQEKESKLSDEAPEKFSGLLEARDLVYRSKLAIKPLQVDDVLTKANEGFSNTPVIPVIGSDGKVVGLLFAHHVRIAYDQEVARRTLLIRPFKKSESA